MIYYGSGMMTDARLGAEQVSAIFLGDELLWRPGFNTLPTDIYFAANGNDMTGLGTQASPLKTLAVANVIPRTDKLLHFRGGDTFEGTLHMVSKSWAISYGSGKAKILSGMSYGALMVNTDNSGIYNLIFEGAGVTLNETQGVLAMNAREDTTYLNGLVIQGCEVMEYGDNGILVSARNGVSGYNNPKILDNDVHDCVGNTKDGHTGGIIMYGVEGKNSAVAVKDLWGLATMKPLFNDVVVTGNHVHDCLGTPGTPNHSGNGIIVAQANRGIVEYNLVEDCGSNNTSYAGPVGCWAWDSIGIKIRHNIVKRQGSSGPDGGGFDLDGGCVDCLLEYNLCIDCQGPGLLLYAFNDRKDWPTNKLLNFKGNIARYNISLRCGSGGFSKYGMFLGTGRPVTSDWKGCLVHNNTIVTEDVNGAAPDNFVVFSYDGVLADHLTGKVVNNIFYHKGSGLLVDMRKNRLTIENNVFYSTKNKSMRYYGFDYTEPRLWKESSATDGPPKEFARNNLSLYMRNPMFKNDSSDDPADYQPAAGSPMYGIGADILTEYGIVRPDVDYLGNVIPLNGKLWTPGAIEPAAALPNRLTNPANIAGSGWSLTDTASIETGQPGMLGTATAQKIVVGAEKAIAELTQARSYGAGPKTVRRGAFVKSAGAPGAALGKIGPETYPYELNDGYSLFDIGLGRYDADFTTGYTNDKLLWSRIQKRPNGYWLILQEVELHPYWTSDRFLLAPSRSYAEQMDNLDWDDPTTWKPQLIGNGWSGLLVDGTFEYLISESYPRNPLVLVGDNNVMLQGSAHYLQSLAYCPVVNLGLSGQKDNMVPYQIGAKGLTATVSGNVIPASGSVVVTALSQPFLTIANLGKDTAVPVTLNGVKGTLRTPSGTLVTDYVFTRSVAGSAVATPANSTLTVDGGTFDNGIAILWFGHNRASTAAVTIQAYADCVAWARSKFGERFIVVSVIPNSGETNGTGGATAVTTINTSLKATYPNNYLDVKTALMNAYDPAKPQDVADRNNGIIPSSLRSDALTLNDKGFKTLWDAELDFMLAKNWLPIDAVYVGGVRND
ncbi:hypothetical protein [Brucella anthropi]|uniref:hypothetical protein n=1 Tax=Brucella anthropi TaxID=529 RepID=UPI00124C7795|nr:hypothetical protein [Brucella anthropi]KAB2751798.1 hypothetical protein F9L05_01295 [Brucella anthropi]